MSAISKSKSNAPRFSNPVKVADPIRRVFDKAGEAVAGVAMTYEWNDEHKQKAHAYLRALVYGPLDDKMVAKVPAMVKRVVEMRFATSCWFQRTSLADITLPGMSAERYMIDYANAQKRFGQPTIQLDAASLI